MKELKQHKRREEVEPDNYLQIAEGIIQRLERQCEETKRESLKHLKNVSQNLYTHARNKGTVSYLYNSSQETTDNWLYRLKSDTSVSNTNCAPLNYIASELIALKGRIDTLPNIAF